MTRELYGNLLSLQQVGLILGFLLIVGHLLVLVRGASFQNFLHGFPRNRKAGIALIVVDFIWWMWLVKNADLGEFKNLQMPILLGSPIMCVLIIVYVEEFLAVRALGFFLLLLACPILEIAFLKLPASRLLLSTLCYVWIVFGLYWVGMPYLLRDQISWILKVPIRFKALAVGGVLYGAAILGCAIAFWGGAL